MSDFDDESVGPPDDDGDDTFERFYRRQQEAAEHSLPDYFLRVLVFSCQEVDHSFGVTLTVGGSTITGTVVSEARYFDSLGDLVEEIGHGVADAFLPAFRHAAMSSMVRAAVPYELVPSSDPLPVFVNLIDCTILSGGSVIASGVSWRGRLASVDGWFLGTIS